LSLPGVRLVAWSTLQGVRTELEKCLDPPFKTVLKGVGGQVFAFKKRLTGEKLTP
jgi:hypothetical protein